MSVYIVTEHTDFTNEGIVFWAGTDWAEAISEFKTARVGSNFIGVRLTRWTNGESEVVFSEQVR